MGGCSSEAGCVSMCCLCYSLVGDVWHNPSKLTQDWWRALCWDEWCAQPFLCLLGPFCSTFTLVLPLPFSCRPNVQEALAATLVLLSGSWYQSPPLRHLHRGLCVDWGGLFLQRCPHVAHLRDIQLSGILLGLGAPEGRDNMSRQAHACTCVCISCNY